MVRYLSLLKFSYAFLLVLGTIHQQKLVAQNMAYVSSEVLSVSPQMVGVNTPEARVALINVVTTGSSSPLALTHLNIGTGNTNIANISNAHVFYTGSSATFNNSNQFGSTIIASTSALLFNGSTSLGTGNNYFWVCYDIPATAQEDTLNVIVNTMVISGNLQTPSPNEPTLKRFIKAPLSGSYTVGTGGDFALLSTAVSNLNIRGMQGNTEFKIISDINETVAASMVEWQELGTGNYTLTISPDAPVLRTITSSATTLLLMSGPDRVIIDGRYNGSGKYLAFHNTNTGQSICVFFNTSQSNTNGCNNSVLRNCILYSGSTTHTFAVNVHVGATGHNNILITENECRKGYYGVNVGVPVGASQVLANYNGIEITNNTIGGTAPGDFINNIGIRLHNTTGAIVSGNEIRDVQTLSAINNAGIEVGINSMNATVAGNRVYNIRNLHTGGYGVSGIALTSGNNHEVYNNLVYDVDGYSNTAGNVRSIYGIRLSGGSGHKVYHNSISISGASMATAAYVSHGIGFIGATQVDFRNNIIENRQTGPAGFKSFAVYQSAASTISLSNHNNYFVNGANAMLAYLNGNDRATLADVQTATAQDAASFFGDPLFDINFIPQSCFANNTAEPFSLITTDFSGVLRAGLPDMGALEYAPVLPVAPSVQSPVLYCENDAPVALSATVTNMANWYVTASGGQGSPTSPTPSTASSGTFSYWVSDSIASTGCNSPRSLVEVMVGQVTSIVQQPIGTAICEGEMVELEVIANGLNLNYEWSLNGTVVTGNNSSTFLWPAVALADGGNYTVLVTGHCGNPVLSDVAALTVLPLPNVAAHASALSACEGELINFTASGALIYSWDFIIDPVNPLPVGVHEFKVTGTDQNNCSNVDSITVEIFELPEVMIHADPGIVCEGDTVNLWATGAITYEWSFGALPLIASSTLVVTVEGTDANGCKNNADTLILVNPLPTVTLADQPIVCLNAGPTTLYGGEPAGGNYYIGSNLANIFDPQDYGLGTITITYIYEDGEGCTNSAQKPLLIDCPGSVFDESLNLLNISLYPNPASQVINLEVVTVENKEVFIGISSATGQMVFNEKTFLTAGANTISINSAAFARGVYFVQLQTENSVVQKKLVLR